MCIRSCWWSLLFVLGLGANLAAARTWTDASGSFKIEAELVRVSDDGASVTLRRTDGEEITLQIDSLSESDRKFLKDGSKPKETRGRDNPFLTKKERAPVAPTGKVNHRRALLIGVNEYKHFRKLEYCGADVQALGKRLTAAGFDRDKVVVIHDAATRSLQPDKEKIVNQITLLLESAAPDDLVFLSFSGHGVRVGGKSYLVPYEGEMPESLKDADRLKTLISLDWLYEKLQACPASTKVFLVDACQNRLFSGDQRSARASVAAESIGQSLQNVPKSVLLMTACAPGEVSHESADLKHGVYTFYLLEALEGRADFNHDGVVSLKEANLYASEKTEHFVRTKFSETQRPSFKGEVQGDVPLAECLRMERITVPDDIDKLEIAIQRIAEGGTITLKPNVYRVSAPLEITRECTIVGATGDPKDVVLESNGKTVLTNKSPRARIQSVSIHNAGTTEPAVLVPEGRLELAKCDLTSEKSIAVSAANETAEPVLSHSVIHHAGQYGIQIAKKARGVIDDCDIFGNTLAGILISEGANPSVKNCKIHNGSESGALIASSGAGSFESCDFYANLGPGIEVKDGGKPTVKNCTIREGKKEGVLVQENGLGTFTDCTLFQNESPGMTVRTGGNPTVKNCTVRDGKKFGVRVAEKGLGSFDDCRIFQNEATGIVVQSGGNPTVTKCKIYDGKRCGVYVYEKSGGTFENCEISGNVTNVVVKDASNPTVKNCVVHDAKEGGIFVSDNGEGIFEDCDVYGNRLSGIEIGNGGNPTLTRCKFRDGKQPGALVHGESWGFFDGCELYGNQFSGVEIRREGNPTFKNCRFYNNVEHGVYIHQNGHGLFENNSLYGNGKKAWNIANDAGSFRRSGNSPNY